MNKDPEVISNCIIINVQSNTHGNKNSNYQVTGSRMGINQSLSLSLSIYIYIYMCVCVWVGGGVGGEGV
jgi:hypothetical protein